MEQATPNFLVICLLNSLYFSHSIIQSINILKQYFIFIHNLMVIKNTLKDSIYPSISVKNRL